MQVKNYRRLCTLIAALCTLLAILAASCGYREDASSHPDEVDLSDPLLSEEAAPPEFSRPASQPEESSLPPPHSMPAVPPVEGPPIEIELPIGSLSPEWQPTDSPDQGPALG